MKISLLIGVLLLVSVGFGDLIYVQNSKIKVVMDDTTGRFGIGERNGTPYISGFPTDMSGSHFVARLDGGSYSNNAAVAPTLPLYDPGRIVENYYLTIQWMRDPIRIWQKLYLLPEEPLRAFCDIEYLAYNDSPDSHDVGFLLYIDALVGTNDNPVLEFATGVCSTSVRFDAGSIPAYWTLYEHSIRQDTSYALAQGVPFGSYMLYPDQIIFGNAHDLETVTWTAFFLPGAPLTDLALLVKWDTIRLSSYSWYIMQIYYGGGYPSFGIKEIHRLEPEFVHIQDPRPNPFNAAVRIPYELSDKSRLVSWNIYNLSGRVVKHSQPDYLEPGGYDIYWDGRADSGDKLPAGVYLLALWADGHRTTKRLVMVE